MLPISNLRDRSGTPGFKASDVEAGTMDGPMSPYSDSQAAAVSYEGGRNTPLPNRAPGTLDITQLSGVFVTSVDEDSFSR